LIAPGAFFGKSLHYICISSSILRSRCGRVKPKPWSGTFWASSEAVTQRSRTTRCGPGAGSSVGGWVGQTIGELFAQDQQAALPLPPRAFDPFVPESAKVDKYQTVRFDTNRYSVPRRWAFETVALKAHVDRIEVVAGTSVIARHARSYARGEWIVQPQHYLAILGRRSTLLHAASGSGHAGRQIRRSICRPKAPRPREPGNGYTLRAGSLGANGQSHREQPRVSHWKQERCVIQTGMWRLPMVTAYLLETAVGVVEHDYWGVVEATTEAVGEELAAHGTKTAGF
jgi:hypothetical protein